MQPAAGTSGREERGEKRREERGEKRKERGGYIILNNSLAGGYQFKGTIVESRQPPTKRGGTQLPVTRPHAMVTAHTGACDALGIKMPDPATGKKKTYIYTQAHNCTYNYKLKGVYQHKEVYLHGLHLPTTVKYIYIYIYIYIYMNI